MILRSNCSSSKWRSSATYLFPRLNIWTLGLVKVLLHGLIFLNALQETKISAPHPDINHLLPPFCDIYVVQFFRNTLISIDSDYPHEPSMKEHKLFSVSVVSVPSGASFSV